MEDRIIEIIKIVSNHSNINLNDKLNEDLSISSIKIIGLIGKLEDEFQIRLNILDYNNENFRTVNSVIQLMNKYI